MPGVIPTRSVLIRWRILNAIRQDDKIAYWLRKGSGVLRLFLIDGRRLFPSGPQNCLVPCWKLVCLCYQILDGLVPDEPRFWYPAGSPT